MATAKSETTVTLTLNRAEAEALLALTGCVAGGRTGDSTLRDDSDNVYDVLRLALNTDAHQTDFYQAMEPGSRVARLR